MGIIILDINKPISPTANPGLQRRASTELSNVLPRTFLMALENHVSSLPAYLTYFIGRSSGFTLYIHFACSFPLASS